MRAANNEGQTAIQLAAMGGHVGVVTALLEGE